MPGTATRLRHGPGRAGRGARGGGIRRGRGGHLRRRVRRRRAHHLPRLVERGVFVRGGWCTTAWGWSFPTSWKRCSRRELDPDEFDSDCRWAGRWAPACCCRWARGFPPRSARRTRRYEPEYEDDTTARRHHVRQRGGGAARSGPEPSIRSRMTPGARDGAPGVCIRGKTFVAALAGSPAVRHFLAHERGGASQNDAGGCPPQRAAPGAASP